jgi:arylsulfatase A-like enzyme
LGGLGFAGAAQLIGNANVLGASSVRASGAGPMQQKLNFVFILMDDLGWRDLTCFGSTFYETPNIDRLRGQGMKFTNAYAACPVCSPTRASIMTGKYPARLGLTNYIPGSPQRNTKLIETPFAQQVPLEEITIAEALQPAGYVSGHVGKWHMGGRDYNPDKQGFALSYVTGGNHVNWTVSPPYQPRKGVYLADALTDEAEKFIEANKDNPFFLYLCHFAVHIPLQAKQEYLAKYEAKADPKQPQHSAIYAAMIQSADESVGRVMKKLDELKIADRTVIIFMSDNGGLSVKEAVNTPSTSNAPLRAGKGYLYEGGIREPLIVKWAGAVKAGGECDVPVCSVDFYPTILEIAGVQCPREQIIDGVSFVPLLRRTGTITRDALYWHYPHYSNQGAFPGAAIRQGDFKLIEFYEDHHVELYNLKDDVGERNNLAGKMPAKAAELRRMLDAWLKKMNARMPTPNPNFDPSKPYRGPTEFEMGEQAQQVGAKTAKRGNPK